MSKREKGSKGEREKGRIREWRKGDWQAQLKMNNE
jgi:hypothetical protein